MTLGMRVCDEVLRARQIEGKKITQEQREYLTKVMAELISGNCKNNFGG
jgi:hypothetical protein